MDSSTRFCSLDTIAEIRYNTDMSTKTHHSANGISEGGQIAILSSITRYVREAAKDNPNEDLKDKYLQGIYDTIQKYKGPKNG